MIPMSSNARRVLAWLVAVVALLSALALALFLQARLDRELLEFPGRERRALYERTRETLRTTCEQVRWTKMVEYCRQQGDFIKRFPECDRECRDLAARFALQPSR